MLKRYKDLKTLMFTEDVNQKMIAKAIGRSASYINHRMNGELHFDQSDMFAICDYLSIPYSEMATYFPLNGIQNQKDTHNASKVPARIQDAQSMRQ